MAAKIERRGVSIFLDGKEVENSAKAIRKEMSTLTNQMAKMTVGSDEYVAHAKKLAQLKIIFDEHNSYQKEITAEYKKMSTGASSFGEKFKGAFQVFAGNIMTKAASAIGELAGKVKDFVKEGIDMAGKAEGIQTAFNKLNQPDLLKNLRQDTKGLVSDLQLMTMAVKAKNFNIPLNDLGKLLKFAQQRAQETGESVDYLSDSIIMGLGRKSPMILDNLGISAARLQADVKKTGDFMQATMNIVNEGLTNQGTLALTSADKATRAAVKWENAQLRIGQKFQWLGNVWSEVSGSIAGAIIEFTRKTYSAEDAVKDFNREAVKQQRELNDIFGAYKKANEGTEEKTKLLEIIKTKYGDYILDLINEKGAITDVELAQERANAALRDSIALKIRDKATNELNTELIEKQANKLNDLRELLTRVKGETIANTVTDQITKIFSSAKTEEEIEKACDEAERILESYGLKLVLKANIGGMNTKYGDIIESLFDTTKKINSEIAKVETKFSALIPEDLMKKHDEKLKEQEAYRKKFNEMNKTQLAAWIKDTKNATSEYLALAKSIQGARFGDASDPNKSKESEQRSKLNDAMKKLEIQNLEAEAVIKKKYLNGEYQTEYEYNQALLKQQEEYDNTRIAKLTELKGSLTAVATDIDKQLADIDNKKIDRELSQAKIIKDIILAANPEQAEKEAYDKRLQELGLFNKEEAEMTTEQLELLKSIRAEYEKKLEQIRKQKQRPENKAATNTLKTLDEEQEKAELQLAQKRKNGLISEQEYRDDLLTIQLAYLAKKKAVENLTDEQIQQLNKKSLEKQQETLNNVSSLKDKNNKGKNKKEPSLKESFNTRVAFLEELYPGELQKTEEFLIQKQALIDEYAELEKQKDKEKWEVIAQGTQFALETMQTMMSAVSSYYQASQDAETAAVNKKYDTQIKAIDKELAKTKLSEKQKTKLQEQKQALEDQRDEEANKIKAEYQEKSFKIQKAQALASTAMAAINAYSSAASVPMIGTVLAPIAAAAAIAAGMIQVATIEKQADAAREGYHTGGFTKSGRWDEPQGVVHSDEFVANRFATANSTLRPVFDLVDYAQRNDTLSSLTKDDIARALRIPGYYAGGYAGTENKTSSSAAPQSADLSGIYGIMDALFEKLDNTLGNIRVINTVAGKEGMKEAFDRYDLIIKNKSR